MSPRKPVRPPAGEAPEPGPPSEADLGYVAHAGKTLAFEAQQKALVRWRLWRDNVPLFYSTCVQFQTDWPSRSVQLQPLLQPAPERGLSYHALLLGTQTGGSDPATLLDVRVAVQAPDAASRQQPDAAHGRDGFSSRAAAGDQPLEVVQAFDHPLGDVDRIRVMPQQPAYVAAKCEGGGITLYDTSRPRPAANGNTAAATRFHDDGDDDDDGGGGAGPSGRLGPSHVHHCERQQGTALEWSGALQGRLFSALADGVVGCYQADTGGGGPCGLQLLSSHAGHQGAVNELCTPHSASDPGPAGPHAFASCGDDGRALLWDMRTQRAALQLVASRKAINGAAFSPTQPHLLALGTATGELWLCDVRRPAGGSASSSKSASGGGGLVQRLKSNGGPVYQVAWSPTEPGGVLAASDAEGRVLLWEPGRTETADDSQLMARPQLLFAHAGHLAAPTDLAWSPVVPYLLACAYTALELLDDMLKAACPWMGADKPPGNVVQVWTPLQDLLPGQHQRGVGDAGADPWVGRVDQRRGGGDNGDDVEMGDAAGGRGGASSGAANGHAAGQGQANGRGEVGHGGEEDTETDEEAAVRVRRPAGQAMDDDDEDTVTE